MTPCDLNDVQKTQFVRILDVFLIGPLMIAGGLALGRHSFLGGAALTALGAGTILYNGWNWAVIRRASRLVSVPP